MSSSEDPPRLGSLAQSARSKKLTQARGLLWFIGGLTIIVNIVMIAILPSQVQNELDKEVQALASRGQVPLPGAVEQVRQKALLIGYLSGVVAIILGVLFV